MKVVGQLEGPVPVSVVGHGCQQVVLFVYSLQTVLHRIVVAQLYLIGPLCPVLGNQVSVRVIAVLHFGMLLPVIEFCMDRLVGQVIGVLRTLLYGSVPLLRIA